MEFGLVFVWITVFLLLGFAALPFATWLLPDVDAGGFAIPLALAVVTLVAHLVGQVAFGWPALLAGLAVVLGLSGVVTHRTDTEPDFGRAGEYTVVFVAGFLLIVLIRGFDPTAAPLPLAIGEKFLDFGLLNTLDRTGSLPPEDMWFAGESVRYYYGGHLLSALLGTLTGTSPEFTYNLALAGFYATLVTAAYGLAGSIVEPRRGSRRLAGALGVFFVGIAGNLSTFVRLLAWRLPDDFAGWLVTRLGFEESTLQWTPASFHYFDASRVIPVDPRDPDSYEAATEFPLFAWFNGDLHAHMMSQPFMLLATAVLLATWRAPPHHRRILLYGALPPLVGLIAFFNLWSLPTVLGLTALGVFFLPDDPADLLPDQFGPKTIRSERSPILEEVRRLAFALGCTVLAFVGGVLWTLPFWTTVVLGGQQNASLTYWEAWTPLGPLLVVVGAFLAAFVAYFGRQASSETVRPWMVIAAGVGFLALTTLFGVAALGVSIPLIVGGWWLLRAETDGDGAEAAAGYETMLVVAGAGLVLLVEFVTIEGERFNLIFKPYVHVWLFWAIGTAAILPRLTAGLPSVPTIDRSQLVWAGRILTAVLLLVTVPYAGFALHGHVTDGTATTDAVGPTLDGTAYLDIHYPEEAPAIRWLDRQSGQPTIVTAAPAGYWWDYSREEGSSAPASLTGLPTVAGWTHERQYRGDAPYDGRVSDVGTIYSGDPEAQSRLLAKHDVEYIYVGPVESSRYRVTVDRLDAVTVANSWEDVTIYRVDRTALSGDR